MELRKPKSSRSEKTHKVPNYLQRGFTAVDEIFAKMIGGLLMQRVERAFYIVRKKEMEQKIAEALQWSSKLIKIRSHKSFIVQMQKGLQ